MFFDESSLISRMIFLIPLLLSLSVHEWAHAWSAWKLGDDTAARLGRLTLNPVAHIDPVGTLLLPLLGVPFGWAKPVPINPGRFSRRVSLQTGLMLTAAAGPLSNICLALGCTVVLALILGLQLGAGAAVLSLLQTGIFLNVVLAVFNALPIPPLDGSRVADALMPDVLRPAWDGLCSIGPIVLIGVLALPIVFGVSLIDWPLAMTETLLRNMIWLLTQ